MRDYFTSSVHEGLELDIKFCNMKNEEIEKLKSVKMMYESENRMLVKRIEILKKDNKVLTREIKRLESRIRELESNFKQLSIYDYDN